MSVRVGNSWSPWRAINGGVPQGSILGVLLFNLTTDNLEDPPEQTRPVTPDMERAADDTNDAQRNLLTPAGDNSASEPDWTHSTPVAEDIDFEPDVTPFRRGNSRFVFLDRARNVRRASSRDPDVTILRDQTIPEERYPVTSAIWQSRPTSKHKYIDDGILNTELNFENKMIATDGHKYKHSVDTQNVFRRTIHNAEAIGMKVNTNKTNLLCVSDLLSFRASAYIYN